MQFTFLADRPSFVPTIAKWYFDQWGHAVTGNSYEATCARIKANLEEAGLPIYLLAVHDDQVLGVAQLKLREMDIYPDYAFWLGGVYVSGAARVQGIASGLCRQIIDIARDREVGTLYLQTERLNGGLYAKLGWQAIEQIHYRGYDVLVMQRQVSADGL
ncbi:GNAT family N-acetyltransferase [Bremerella sp. P1]|uniref:GNAT family N-acetyltransferase n=1 Tax=Bremerella sp. P1 TaxID=3026424 RepID=UPI002368883E|nr:GNAT family N-acetyltransferase [Bremerella sp. P1]WDI40432.1 GNAT family N-acetyltransferase [Bremerella sp. P1]